MTLKHFVWLPAIVFLTSIAILVNYGMTSIRLAERSNALSRSAVQLTTTDAELRRCVAGVDELVRRIARMERMVSAERVRADYAERSRCLTPLIDRVTVLARGHEDADGSDESRDAVAELRVRIMAWLDGAHSVLGMHRSLAVLTLDAFQSRSAQVESALLRIERQVRRIPERIDRQNDRQHDALLRTLGVSMLVFSVVMACTLLLLRRFTQDVNRIAAAMQKLCRGNVDIEVFTRATRGELLRLADGVRAFRDALMSVKRAEERSAHLARHDPLTEVHNRRHFMELGNTLFAREPSRQRVVLKIDLDRFKHVNDTYGHAAGDAYLVDTVRVMRACLEEGDILARLGGDEFAIIVSDPGAESSNHGAVVAERLVGACDTVVKTGGRSIDRSISIGVSRYPHDGRSVDALLVSADIALYEAKSRGRGRFVCVDDDMIAADRAVIALASELERAVERHELLAHFQPKIDLLTHEVCGFEALVRWQHPQRGLLTPWHFVETAESSELIIRIGEQVLLQAIQAVQRLERDGLKHTVSVNASARELSTPGYAERFIATLCAQGVDPGDISVELLETVTLESRAEQISINLNRLNEHGVRIWIDDFGVGFSTVGVLQHPFIHGIKIDRRFVCCDASAQADKTLLDAIVGMARGMGKRCLLEGVENAQQLNHAQRIGCDVVQGYHFAKPMPIEALVRWCAERNGSIGTDRRAA